MSPSVLRTRIRMALREVGDVDQAEILRLAIALPDGHITMPALGIRTPAGAKNAMAILVRAAFGKEIIADNDVEQIPHIVAVLNRGKDR